VGSEVTFSFDTIKLALLTEISFLEKEKMFDFTAERKSKRSVVQGTNLRLMETTGKVFYY
jgi:hypothetical protein